jgi:hypothetical protein
MILHNLSSFEMQIEAEAKAKAKRSHPSMGGKPRTHLIRLP